MLREVHRAALFMLQALAAGTGLGVGRRKHLRPATSSTEGMDGIAAGKRANPNDQISSPVRLPSLRVSVFLRPLCAFSPWCLGVSVRSLSVRSPIRPTGLPNPIRFCRRSVGKRRYSSTHIPRED